MNYYVGTVNSSGAQFIMFGSDAEISGNTAASNGGGVYMRAPTNTAQFTMTGSDSKISGNIANDAGGGVFCTAGNVTMEAGELSGNSDGSQYHQFANAGGGTQKWPAGTRASVTGTFGVGNEYVAPNADGSNFGDSANNGDKWYPAQLAGTVIKAWKDGTGIRVTGVGLNKSTLNLNLAYPSEQLVAAVFPANAAFKTLIWSSSNPGAAFVDQTGRVTMATTGSATITVTTADGARTATCVVTVTP
jgi:hypothetical protein